MIKYIHIIILNINVQFVQKSFTHINNKHPAKYLSDIPLLRFIFNILKILLYLSVTLNCIRSHCTSMSGPAMLVLKNIQLLMSSSINRHYFKNYAILIVHRTISRKQVN